MTLTNWKQSTALIVTLMIASPAQAGVTPPSCEQKLQACDAAVHSCDKALDARNKEISLCRLGLTQTLDAKREIEAQLKAEQEKHGSLLRNPWLYLALGVVAGVVISK